MTVLLLRTVAVLVASAQQVTIDPDAGECLVYELQRDPPRFSSLTYDVSPGCGNTRN